MKAVAAAQIVESNRKGARAFIQLSTRGILPGDRSAKIDTTMGEAKTEASFPVADCLAVYVQLGTAFIDPHVHKTSPEYLHITMTQAGQLAF